MAAQISKLVSLLFKATIERLCRIFGFVGLLLHSKPLLNLVGLLPSKATIGCLRCFLRDWTFFFQIHSMPLLNVSDGWCRLMPLLDVSTQYVCVPEFIQYHF